MSYNKNFNFKSNDKKNENFSLNSQTMQAMNTQAMYPKIGHESIHDAVIGRSKLLSSSIESVERVKRNTYLPERYDTRRSTIDIGKSIMNNPRPSRAFHSPDISHMPPAGKPSLSTKQPYDFNNGTFPSASRNSRPEILPWNPKTVQPINNYALPPNATASLERGNNVLKSLANITTSPIEKEVSILLQRHPIQATSCKNLPHRPYMEDGWFHSPLSSDSSLVGVLDGHGGRKAVDHCISVFAKYFLQISGPLASPVSIPAMADVMLRTFGQVDIENRDQLACFNQGTTAIICFIGKDYTNTLNLLCAHVGDSRGVIIDESGKPVPLTEDHKAGLEREHRRVTQAGGHFLMGRLGGQILVTRALGDHNLKSGDGLIGVPDIATRPIQQKRDRCLILASDGFWEAVSNETAADVTMSMISQSDGAPLRGCVLATKLMELALKSGSKDNVTIVCIPFQWDH